MTYDSTIEDLIDAVEAHVRDNIKTYVAAVNSAATKSTALQDIREIEVSDQDPLRSGKYPRIQLYVDTLEVEQVSTGFAQATMAMIAVVAINDGNAQRIRLLRYTEALRQLLRDYHTLGQASFDVDPRGMVIQYFPTDPEVAVGVATIRFRVIKDIPA